MKKIGISTVHMGFNDEITLQALASKMILQKLGYQGVNILLKGKGFRIKKISVIALRLLMQPHNIKKRVSVYDDKISKSYYKQTKELFIDFRYNKIKPFSCPFSARRIRYFNY